MLLSIRLLQATEHHIKPCSSSCGPVWCDQCHNLSWSILHAVIVESTYGVSKHLPRDQREQRFVEKVRGVLTRGGRVLLPVVALGRAQVQNAQHRTPRFVFAFPQPGMTAAMLTTLLS